MSCLLAFYVYAELEGLMHYSSHPTEAYAEETFQDLVERGAEVVELCAYNESYQLDGPYRIFYRRPAKRRRR